MIEEKEVKASWYVHLIRLAWKTALTYMIYSEVGGWTFVLVIWLLAKDEINSFLEWLKQMTLGFAAMRDMIENPDDPENRLAAQMLRERRRQEGK